MQVYAGQNQGLQARCVIFQLFDVPECQIKVMLHEAICNDYFKRNTALQCWNNVATIRCNVTTML